MFIQYDEVHKVLVDEGGLPVYRDGLRELLPHIKAYLKIPEEKLDKIALQIMRKRYPGMLSDRERYAEDGSLL